MSASTIAAGVVATSIPIGKAIPSGGDRRHLLSVPRN